jgi:hypothetical protein
MLKIYEVTFNDGGWHQSLPKFTVVSESKEEAKEKVQKEQKGYTKEFGWDCWCSEYKIEGYVIEVFDEKTYNRDKNLENLIDG